MAANTAPIFPRTPQVEWAQPVLAANTTTAQVVNVTIVNDNKVEADEVYNVAIGTLNALGRNVSLGTSSGTGTITNDDTATSASTTSSGEVQITPPRSR